MKHLFRAFILLISLFAVVISCKKKPVEILEVSPNTEINCIAEGDTLEFSILCNGEWNVNTPEWCLARPSSGDGDATLIVFVQPNTSDEQRSGKINITSGTISVTVEIVQEKNEEEEYIPLNPNSDYVDLGIDKVDIKLSYDTLSGQLNVTYPDSDIPTLYEGAAFVLPDEYNYDIRVVDSYTTSGNTLTVQTSPGNMCNLFRNISFTLSTEATQETKSQDGHYIFPPVSYGYLDDKGVYHELYNQDEITKSKTHVNLLDYEKNFDGSVIWDGKWGNISWKKCSDRYTLDAKFEFDFGEKTSGKKKIGDLKYFSSEMHGSVTIDRLLRYEIAKEYENEEDEIIEDNIIETGVFKFAPGGIPVVILVYTHLGREVSFNAEGNITAEAGFKLRGDLRTGLKWSKEKEVEPIVSAQSTFTPYEAYFEAQATATAKISYYPRVEVGLYSKSGFQIDLKPYIKETIKAGVRGSSEDKDYFGWRSETYTGMDMNIVLKADFGFWDKKIWESDPLNPIEDTPVFYAPQRITVLSPENNTILKNKTDSVKIEVFAESYSPITDKFYPCPFAFINFKETNGTLTRRFSVADKNGNASTVWYPFMNPATKSGSPADTTFQTEELTSSIVDNEGKVISESTIILKFKEDTLKEMLRETLIQFYEETNGDNWTIKDNWCSERPIEEWYGIESENGLYTIKLVNNNLSGSGSLADSPLLKSICLERNQLTSLNVSGCTALEKLYLTNNKLSALDLSGCTTLTLLECGQNQLSSLDLSQTTSLETLLCPTNLFTSLSVSGLKSLKELNCSSNKLATLDLLQTDALSELSCNKNQLTSLDLSQSPSLKELYCCTNQLTSLDLSNKTKLTRVDCYSNKLSSLNFSGCTSLKRVNCHSNSLTSLDNLSGITTLTTLDCSTNLLSGLKVSGCSSLTSLNCDSNQLSSLDLSGCTSSGTLNCKQNQLTSLILDDLVKLKTIHCSNNQLTSLDVSKCTALTSVSCFINNLTSLNLSMCPSLESITCYSNQLSTLNISGCNKLRTLDCRNNKITSLNTTGLSALVIVLCEYNQIPVLDLTASKGTLSSVRCMENQITSLDVSDCIKLKTLSCALNNITALDVAGCTLLEELSCNDNMLTTLNVSDLNSLRLIRCQNNQISSLTLSEAKMTHLWCQNNKIVSEIPEWFDNLSTFEYDRRYTNYHKDENGKVLFTDNGVGWWYPGEPDKGYHKRD